MPIPIYRCDRGHIYHESSSRICPLCDEERPVCVLAPTEVFTLLERDHALDEEQAHILADEALLTALYPSEPDLVRRYERLKGSFWYA